MSILHASIGIDLGSSKIVVAVAKKGGVEILCNDASYRQTPTLVSYGPERIVGDKAVQKIKKNVNNSVILPPRWIGELTPTQLTFEKQFNFSKVQLDASGQVVFSVNYEGNQIQVPAVQVLGGVFKEALEVIRLNQIDQKEAVVSVPSFFTPIERQAVIDAAKIAGMEITKLYNESAANVMNYGIFRRGDLDSSMPRLVGFVDMGHSKTSIFFANIWKDKAEIVAEVSNSNLGTRNLDHKMREFYIQMFEKQHKIDLHDSPKSMFRLLEAIERQRKILTANPEAVLAVDCLYEDIDFNHLLTREEFESVNKHSIDQMTALVHMALKELPADLAKNLHSVERIGGGTRIPFVEKVIAHTFKLEALSKTLDANESVARGCAIQAAMLNPLFKVPAYQIPEKLAFPIHVKLQYEGEEEKNKELFKAGVELGKSVSIAVLKQQPLTLGLAAVNRHTGHQRDLFNAKLDKLSSKEPKFEGKICFLVDRNGLPQLERFELTEQYVEEIKTPVKPVATKDAKNKPKEGEDKMEIEQPEGGKEEFKIEKKERTRVTNLPFHRNIHYGLEKTQLDAFKQFESQISAKEQTTRDTQAAKYAFESFIYNTRNQLNLPANASYVLPDEKEAILKDLQAGENWLYDEGTNSTKEQYETQLAKLKKTSSNFTNRLTKMDQARAYHDEAAVALRDFPTKNAELMGHGSQVHLNELNQKAREGQELLGHFAQLFSNPTIQSIEAFNFEDKKTAINKSYEGMNHVLSLIRKEKEDREREAKKKLDEETKKRAEEEAKKKAEEESRKKPEEESKKDGETAKEGGSMEVEK
jgi:heat shock protein 4